MNEVMFDFDACFEDTRSALATLSKQHVRYVQNKQEAALGLATCLMEAAKEVLEALYGSKEMAQAHLCLQYGTKP